MGGGLTERGETVAGRCSVTEAGAERAGSGGGEVEGGDGEVEGGLGRRR